MLVASTKHDGTVQLGVSTCVVFLACCYAVRLCVESQKLPQFAPQPVPYYPFRHKFNCFQVAFVQEYRSEQSLQALTTLLPPHATCLRGGKVRASFFVVAQQRLDKPAVCCVEAMMARVTVSGRVTHVWALFCFVMLCALAHIQIAAPTPDMFRTGDLMVLRTDQAQQSSCSLVAHAKPKT